MNSGMLSPAAEIAYRREQIAQARARSQARKNVMPAGLPAPSDVIGWIEKNFYLADSGDLLTLHSSQRRALEEALAVEPDGYYRYATVVWSWPKKSAKSSIIAAVCDYMAEHRPRAYIQLVANDQRQADSRVGEYIRQSIRTNQAKGARTGIKITPSGYRIEYPNGSLIEMLPIDPSGEAGGNPDLVVNSELHGWKHEAHQKMFAEVTISPNKFGRAQRWVDTYAGYSGQSSLLEHLYDLGVKQGQELFEPGSELYANGQARLFCAWITRRLLPWQLGPLADAYYAEEASTLTPDEFRRMHGNEFVSPLEVFVPSPWWDNCKGDMPAFDSRTPVVVGMDAGVSSDCFALVGISRIGEMTYVRFTRVWRPTKDNKVDFADVERVIREELVKQYNVVQICYDPSQLHDMTTRLTRDAVAWMYEFSQAGARLVADKQLYDCIRDRRIIHDGDPILAEHIKNANAKVDPQDHSLRIVKRSESLKIDSAVALSMCNSEARRLSIS